MTDFLLIHSPLLFPGVWEPVAEQLRRMGHEAVVPVLREDDDADGVWKHQVEAIARAAEQSGIERPVLAGHSGAGRLLPVAGSALSDVSAYLFVDAVLPNPGSSYITTLHPSLRSRLEASAKNDTVPPWNEWWPASTLANLLPDPTQRQRFVEQLRPVPLALFDDIVPDVPGWPDAPCGYLRLSEPYRAEEAEAARNGWAVATLAGGHLDLLSRPKEVANAMVSLLDRTGAGA